MPRTDLAACVAIALAWAGFFWLSGTITSGFHLTDDHEILEMVAHLRRAPFLEVARHWLATDFQIRFRPLYYVHRLAAAAAFGDDLVWWSAYTAVLAVGTTVFLYLALRSLRFPPLAALAFAFFTLCGEQASIWWRLGPSETIGMFLLSTGLLGLARWANTGSTVWRLVFWSGMVMASLCKESFLALLPALAFAAVWCVAWSRRQTWLKSLVACLPEVFGFAVVFLGGALVVVFLVGTEKIGYAGIRGTTPAQAALAARRLLGPRELFTLLALAILTVLAVGVRPRATWSSLIAWVPALLFAALVIGSQAVLYAKSGMAGRYGVPGALGLAFLVACLLRLLVEKERAPEGTCPDRSRARIAAGRYSWPLLVLAVSVLCLAPPALMRAVWMTYEARDFAVEGRETQAFLDALVRLPSTGELVVAGGLVGVFEHFSSVNSYLSFHGRGQNVLFHFVEPDSPLSHFEQRLVRQFEDRASFRKFRPGPTIEMPAAVGVLRGDERQFLQRTPWFDRAAYSRRPLPGTFALFVRGL